jgi:hypothetical protein
MPSHLVHPGLKKGALGLENCALDLEKKVKKCPRKKKKCPRLARCERVDLVGYQLRVSRINPSLSVYTIAGSTLQWACVKAT